MICEDFLFQNVWGYMKFRNDTNPVDCKFIN